MNNFSAEELDQALSRCESEPIHQIGHIQPHGALLVLSPTIPRIVLQASSNLGEIVDLNSAEVCGNPLALVIGTAQADQIEKLIQEVREDHPAVAVVSVSHQGAKHALHARVFLSGSMFVMELIRDRSVDQGQDIGFSVLQLQRSLLTMNAEKDIYRYFDHVATIVRELISFDRVMVYRFDSHWDGEVIAESSVESAHSYLGMHFPASDIPPQARRLYTTNLVRQIADVDDERVPVLPVLNPANQLPLDMTHASLRSLSSVHVEYLRNMGVSASLSISLLQDGVLWGLIACHHMTPRQIPYPLLEASVLISEVVSTRLSLTAISAQRSLGSEANRIIGELLKNITTGTAVDLKSLLLPDLQALLSATGVVMVVEGKIYTYGEVPESKALDGLLTWLSGQPATDVMSCDFLAKQYAPASAYADIAAGCLAAPVSQDTRNCIVWLRKAKTRTVHWAGRPEKTLSRDAAGVRLSPRNSFEGWTETWRERCESWAPHEIEVGRLISEVLTKSLSQKSKLEIEQAKSKQAEQALAQQNRLLNAIIENIPHMIFLKRASDLRFEMFNRAGEALLGLDRSELLGRSDYDLFPRDQADFFTQNDRATLASGNPTDVSDESISTPQGMRNLHTKKLPLYDAMGQPQYLLGISEDITERKLAEEALAKQADLLERTAEMAKIGGWDLDLATRRVSWSKETARLHEVDASYVAPLLDTGDKWYPPEAWPTVSAAVSAAIEHGTPYDLEVPFITAKGRNLWVRIQGFAVVDAGKTIGLRGTFQDISERKQTENALKESEERFRGAFETAAHGIALVSLQGGFIKVNASLSVMLGYSNSDLLATDFQTITHPDDLTTDLNFLHQLLERQIDSYQMEKRYLHKKGHVIWVLLSVSLVRTGDGAPVHFVSQVIDITDRKNGEATLLAAKQAAEAANSAANTARARLQLAMSSANMGIWDWDLVSGVLVWDTRMYELYGISPDTFGSAYDAWLSAVSVEDQAMANRAIELALADVQPYDIEFRASLPDGTQRWIKANGIVTRNAAGQPLTMAGINYDITQRLKAEAEIQASEHRMRVLLDTIADGIIVIDTHGCIQTLNPAAERLFGYMQDEVQGHNIKTFMPASYAHEHDGYMHNFLDTGVKKIIGIGREVIGQRKDGSTFPVDLAVSEMVADGQRMFTGIVRDVSPRKAAENALRAAKESAEAANRAKSNFLANMSHEIRTPMNGILGMLQLLQHTELTTRQIDYTHKAEGATQALLGIINDILDFSKVEAGKLELDNQALVIGDLLRELSVILSANLGSKNVEVLFKLEPDVPPVVIGDALRLRQILINLAGNALKFTEQGEVVLSIRVLKRDADQVELEFSIRDTGIGIPADKLDYIFEGFSQAEASTSRRFGGTGLGLPISQRLVALMGGTLAVESDFGQGSRFFFSIPVGVGPALAAATNSSSAAPAASSFSPAALIPGRVGLRVLIVDDNALSREILSEMASSMGWQAESAASGEAAMAHLQQADAPLYDLVLMDWRMPGMDGWEATCKIRTLEHGGQAPVVIMVTAASRELLSHKTKLETDLIDGYLVKPITVSMLYEAVAEAIVERKGEHIRHSALPASAQLAGLRLLVVEDNLLNQQIARELLENCGAQIAIAGGGLSGVEQALAADPPFDAILMDVQMPDIDGLEATRRIRAMPRMLGVPIIAMTANAMEADRQACCAVGMVDHVAKPIDQDALVNTVLRHAGHRGQDALVPTTSFETLSPPAPVFVVSATATDASFMDVDSAIKRLGGNREFYNKIALGFRSESTALVAQLQRHVTGGEYTQAKRSAHTLRGLAAVVGAVSLSAHLQNIESILANTLTNTLAHPSSETAATLVDMSADLTSQLARVLAALPPSVQPSVVPTLPQLNNLAAALLDVDAFAANLQELAVLLKLRDMRATTLGQKLRQEFGNTLDTGQLEQLSALEQALAQLDFVRAIDACNALLPALSLPVGGTTHKEGLDDGS